MGVRLGGRARGTPNKTTATVREIILAAVDELGGHQRMVDWVREDPANERVFWGTIMPRVLPKEVNVGGQEGNPLNLGIRISFVSARKAET